MSEHSSISSAGSTRGSVSWIAPSNIALVKYWGKKGFQIPANPSVSMTLNQSVTVMELEYDLESADYGISLDFYFDGKRHEAFQKKISEFLQRITFQYPFLERVNLVIKTRNTFPHSAGIASSASSMAALALCLLSVRSKVPGGGERHGDFFSEASGLARQGSGSASRSVYGGYVFWGHHPEIPGSDDHFAMPLPGEVHPSFKNMRDAILLVSSRRKSVSSRAGHTLMDDHPFARPRYELAAKNAIELVRALSSGDMESFIRITEQEAMMLHALMMTSKEPFILLQPNTLGLMESIRSFRQETSIPVCFTIDAGPNIHLLYPGEHEAKVKDFIQDVLVEFLENGHWIDDHIGQGPVNLNE